MLITYVKNEMTLRRNYEMIYSKLQHLPTPGDPLGIWKLVRSNSRPLNKNCVKIPHPSAEFDSQLFCKRQEQRLWLSTHLPATDLTIQALKFRPCRRLLLSHQLAKGNSFSLNTSMSKIKLEYSSGKTWHFRFKFPILPRHGSNSPPPAHGWKSNARELSKRGEGCWAFELIDT